MESNNPDQPGTNKVNVIEHAEIHNEKTSANFDMEVLSDEAVDEAVMIPGE